jgi:hypothetical protein
MSEEISQVARIPQTLQKEFAELCQHLIHRNVNPPGEVLGAAILALLAMDEDRQVELVKQLRIRDLDRNRSAAVLGVLDDVERDAGDEQQGRSA